MRIWASFLKPTTRILFLFSKHTLEVCVCLPCGYHTDLFLMGSAMLLMSGGPGSAVNTVVWLAHIH
ncbi:hypothetical protein LEMLEM_LOCUS1076 [Lemmus lemmus]